MSLSGTLSTMPLPDLLQWLATAGKTGMLQIERQKVGKWIQFAAGRVVGCSTDDPPQRLGQYLLSREMITEAQLIEALALQESSGQHLGATLVEMGVLDPGDVSAHLEGKAEETIYSLFDWNDGVFRYADGIPAEHRNHFPVNLQVEDILLRGLKRFDEMKRIREVFPNASMVLRYTELPPSPEIFQNKMARTMYATIDGERSIDDILLHLHASEYLVYKFLFELRRKGFIDIAPKKPSAEKLAPAPTAPTERVTAPAPGTVSTAAVAVAAPPAVATPVGELGAQLAEVRSVIESGQLEEALDTLDALYREHPGDDGLTRLRAEAEATFVERTYRHAVPPDKVPVLKQAIETLSADLLSPHDFFLLSRIDGTWDVKSIIQVAPVREVEALRTLKRMRERGVIELTDESATSS